VALEAALSADHCAACHCAQGEGGQLASGLRVVPPLAGNRAVTQDPPANLGRAIALGGFGPVTAANPRPLGMPPHAHVLSDAQIAAVATFLRRSRGAPGATVGRMDTVTGIRLFIRVVETGSFSKASASVGITQPTATKHVAALEKRLGARLLHRSTRGVTPTEVGAAYYDKCTAIARAIDEADNLALLMQARLGGTLRISTSVTFGRRVLTPLVLEFMRQHPELQVELSFEDRYVNLVEQGIDVAVRMGRLADSQLGARYLGTNPWVLVAAPAYLAEHAKLRKPADLSQHAALIYSTVQGDDRWHFTGADGRTEAVPVRGPLRSNNLSALLAAARDGLGVAVLPWYAAQGSVHRGEVLPLLERWTLPVQEVHAVFPSPKQLPAKVRSLCDFLAPRFGDRWWTAA
jgi:DNA-binding transcriptional LysR family regulator